MRIGFVHGVLGDPFRLQRAMAQLQGCDTIVSLGDWLGEGPPAPPFLEALEGDPRFRFLAGAHERRWAKRGALSEPIRGRLLRLPSVSLEHGLAVVGRSFAKGKGGDGLSRLVAPLAVYAHARETRLWREVGGLVRVDEAPTRAIAWGDGARRRLDLGPGGARGPGCAVIDLAAETLQVFEMAGRTGVVASGAKGRRASARRPEQIRLAV
jgi:hypothetical protein